MHVDGKSDGSVVPAKQPNKAEGMAAEAVEGRGPIKGNTGKQNARPGHRAGPMRQVRLNVYAMLQKQTRRSGSRRFCTMWTWIGYARRTLLRRSMPQRESMA